MTRQPPSLVDLCVQLAVDNVRYLGNVGETDNHLLERILCHCTLDQLKHIEKSTVGRDLSPVTDKFWRAFYKRKFGVDSFNTLIEKMERKNVTFKWKALYEAKLKEREAEAQKVVERLKQRYQEAEAVKQSRQVQICTKVPPSSKKRSFFGGAVANNIYNTKSSLMKKAKLDFVNSREVKNIAAMKNKVPQKSCSLPSPRKPTSSGTTAAPSSSKFAKPIPRRGGR